MKIMANKFKLDFDTRMIDVLRDMGIKEAFQPGKADLSDMVAEDGHGINLALENIWHKAVVEVNEEGTEAAADLLLPSSAGCTGVLCRDDRRCLWTSSLIIPLPSL